jgi:hypothetical protein
MANAAANKYFPEVIYGHPINRLHTDNYLECMRTRQPPVLNPDLGYKIMVAIKLGVDSDRAKAK